ncbi:DUF4360 domain-containing protein [Polyangium jinanense]|uniref:DUF4360 domain-containing protein n=1 Tax=Polyangium jinanense TaxID=2829994 RepID=A0A9X4AQ73_9BACT|nr:DUF4360 domain-containing protein [Polyangium jinanense]MDC3952418.1 DUF4360 domain-containing protein [Polyangium jinanense]MDC3980046.1 DUF4360 domain-containing protein [Polyangium jinanense]
MKKTLARVLFGLGLSALFAPAVAEAEVPPEVSLRSVTALGTGCPLGSVRAIVANDGQHIALADGALSASAGPGVPPSEQRVFCQVILDLDHTPGYSYAVTNEYGFRGHAELDAGVTATLDVERYFTGELGENPIQTTLRGPFADRFVVREPQGAVGPFSPCGAQRPLNIRTAVNVSTLGNPSGSGRIRLTPAWGVQILRLHWRRCG